MTGLDRNSLTPGISAACLIVAEKTAEKRRFLGRPEMNGKIVVYLTEKKDMGLKYKRNIAVEFKYGIKPAYQETSEWTEFIETLDYDLRIIVSEGVERSQKFDKIWKIQIILVLARLIVVLVDFVDNFICNHVESKFLMIPSVLSGQIANGFITITAGYR